MSLTNENDITKFDSDLVGAGDMVITGATQVACVSRFSRRALLLTHDNVNGTVTITKTPPLDHRVRFVAYSSNKLYLTAPADFSKPGHIYVFHKNSLGAPLASIPDATVNGPVITQASISVFLYSRSDRPSLVARDKDSYEVIAEVQTEHKIVRIYADPTQPGKFFCTNEINNEVEVINWDDIEKTFSFSDPIVLPNASGLIDLIIRDDEMLYTTRSHVVHYNYVTDTLSFNYHDFMNQFVSIDAVTAIDFGSADDPEASNPDRLGYIEIRYIQSSPDSTRGKFISFGECSAGEYEIEWLSGMPQIIPGEFSPMGEAPGIGAGPYQGLVLNHDDVTVRLPIPPVTGGIGELSPGKYDSRANGIAAYTGVATPFTHTGGRIWMEIWDADFTDNDTDLADNGVNFRLRQLTGLPNPEVPPGSTGVPIPGTSIVIYNHANLSGNDNVTAEYLTNLEANRLRDGNSREYRNRFVCNPLLEEFGELYGTNRAPFEQQFHDIGPKTIIRMVNNTHIALDSARGRVTFSGALALRINFDKPSPSRARDTQYCQDFDFVEQFNFGEDTESIEPVNLPIVRSRDSYPYAHALTLPGEGRRVWGEGKNWNSMFFAGDVSVCAWVRPVSNGNHVLPAEDWQRIISNKDTWKSELGFHLNIVAPDPDDPLTNGRIEFFASGGNTDIPGDPSGYNGITSIDSLTLTDGNWHFVAAVAGISTGRVYHNGEDVTRLSNAGLVRPSTLPMRIGRISNQDIDPDFFKGDLSDIRVYNTALSAERIMDIFESTREQFGV